MNRKRVNKKLRVSKQTIKDLTAKGNVTKGIKGGDYSKDPTANPNTSTKPFVVDGINIYRASY